VNDRMRGAAVLVVVVLTACATGPKTVALPTGQQGLELDCSGAAYTFEFCKSDAAKACHGPYQIVSEETSAPYESGARLGAPMSFVGSNRRMVVVCGAAPYEGPRHGIPVQKSAVKHVGIVDNTEFMTPSSKPPPDLGKAFVGLSEDEAKDVVAKVCVSAQGKVESVTVTQSSGSAKIDEAATKLLSSAEYKPTLIAGNPIATCKSLKADFKLTAH